MKIQSLSICVPGNCPNSCEFCVAHMHKNDYKNQIEKNKAFHHLYKEDYYKRMAFARDNGCNTLIFTGNGEPLMNRRFMKMVSEINKRLDKPFRKIELQTSGVTINEETLRWLRNDIGVTTISLSVSNLFNFQKNMEIMHVPKNLQYDLLTTFNLIKKYDFILRMCLNISNWVNLPMYKGVEHIFTDLRVFNAEQVTFRKLYRSGKGTKQDRWIDSNKEYSKFWEDLNDYIARYGRRLEKLPFGAIKYSVHEISTVIDKDCMSTKEDSEALKYLILRQNCKLYSKWDDKGSLVF